jgi:hypothetical protein
MAASHAQTNQFANSVDDIESDLSNVLLVVDNNLAADSHWHQLPLQPRNERAASSFRPFNSTT